LEIFFFWKYSRSKQNQITFYLKYIRETTVVMKWDKLQDSMLVKQPDNNTFPILALSENKKKKRHEVQVTWCKIEIVHHL